MADIKKFLDKGGVSTLWSQIAAEVKKVDDKVAGQEARLAAAEGKIEALEKSLSEGGYDDTDVKNDIKSLETRVKALEDAE